MSADKRRNIVEDPIDEDLADRTLVPIPSRNDLYCLGPIDLGTADTQILRENRSLPIRSCPIDVKSWEQSLRGWPTTLKGWTDWVMRMKPTYESQWKELNIYDAIILTLVEPQMNAPMIAAASLFWSSNFNAFLFPCGPIGPTLLDVTMLTSFKPIGAQSSHLNFESTYKFENKSGTGWAKFMKAHMRETKNVTDREHAAFLMMWCR